MRKFILGTAIILSLIWIYILFINYSVVSNVNIPFIGQIETKTTWLLLCFGLFTMLIDCLSAVWYIMSKTDLNKNYQLKMDKMSVESDNDKSQVRILENKIKTLEAALEKLTKKD